MRTLKCVQCKADIGPARTFRSGRQIELCPDCRRKNLVESRRQYDLRRAGERKSVEGVQR
jgi:DNA-directed RNA polymerase subunit RPC12/RpoP